MLSRLIWLICKLLGWKFDPSRAKGINKYVLIGVPHTSNWDFLPAVGFMSTLPFKASFAIKSEWMKFPISIIMKSFGAVGLDRSKAKDPSVKTTDILAELFDSKDKFALGISPEGSRSLRTKWKSGFYFIALKAKVPILLASMDYKKKTTYIGKIIHPSGDFEADMKLITDHYRNMNPRIRENYGLDSRFTSENILK